MADAWKCPGCQLVWGPHVDFCKRCAGGGAEAPPKGQPTLRTLWEEHYEPWGRLHLKKSWKRVKHGHGAHLLAFLGDLPWDHITHARLDEYCALRLSQRTLVGNREVKPATVNNEVATLKACLNWCLTGAPVGQRPIAGPNPTDGYPELPVTKERQFHLTESDFVKILEHARPLLRRMLVFAFETGMRRDEFRCLQWHEVDLERAVVRLPAERVKGGKKGRDVPLSDIAMAVLRSMPKWHEKPAYVFENPKQNNKPVSKTALYEWFCDARDKAGVRGPKDQAVWTHTLRKSFGTINAMTGMPIYMLMDLMGHTSPEVHFEYTKMSPEYFETAREKLNKRRGPQPAQPAAEEAPKPAASPLLKFVTGE